MKLLVKDIECTCGGNIHVKIAQPKRHQPTIAKSRCSQCDSLYMFTCKVQEGSKEFIPDIDIKLLETTEFLQNEFDCIRAEKLSATEFA